MQSPYSAWHFAFKGNIYTTAPLIVAQRLNLLFRNVKFVGLTLGCEIGCRHKATFVVLLKLSRRRQEHEPYFESVTLRVLRQIFSQNIVFQHAECLSYRLKHFWKHLARDRAMPYAKPLEAPLHHWSDSPSSEERSKNFTVWGLENTDSG